MKRWQKLLLALLVVLIVSQIPFAYRRYKLGRLHAGIVVVQSQPRGAGEFDGINEFIGVSHVHSFLGGHSTGTFQEIVAAAESNHLDFVLMTEHPAAEFSTSAMTLQGLHGTVLFVNGNEVGSFNGDRVLLFPGDDQASFDQALTVDEILSRRTSSLAVIAYPDEFKSWDAKGYQGIEIYNVYTNARQINPLTIFFDALWSYRSYPDLLFARFYERPTAALRKWDEEIARRGERLVAMAGNDAHANIGFSLQDRSGNTLLGLKLDPFERSFRLVRLHVLLRSLPNQSLTQESLLTALKNGNCFIGYDVFGDTNGFRFTATDANEQRMMGDVITLESEVRLEVKLPVAGRIQLVKNGTVIRDEQNAARLELYVREKGAYRVEAYLSQLPEPAGSEPWIISNPIYVK
jgi:hypothetical protein